MSDGIWLAVVDRILFSMRQSIGARSEINQTNLPDHYPARWSLRRHPVDSYVHLRLSDGRQMTNDGELFRGSVFSSLLGEEL